MAANPALTVHGTGRPGAAKRPAAMNGWHQMSLNSGPASASNSTALFDAARGDVASSRWVGAAAAAAVLRLAAKATAEGDFEQAGDASLIVERALEQAGVARRDADDSVRYAARAFTAAMAEVVLLAAHRMPELLAGLVDLHEQQAAAEAVVLRQHMAARRAATARAMAHARAAKAAKRAAGTSPHPPGAIPTS